MLTSQDKLTAALLYFSYAWQVIPLVGKRPVTQWTTDPALNQRAIELLFEADSQLNIGVKMGSPSNLMGLDLDGEAGFNLFEELIPKELRVPTFTFLTPNNGIRYLYRCQGHVTPKSIRHNGKEAIRILGDGTQTVMPPSSINGRQYRWTHTHNLAEYPTAIIEKLTQPFPPPLIKPTMPAPIIGKADAYYRARKYIQACDPAISGSGGHNQTYKIAVRITRGFGLSFHEALDLLMNEYNPKCQPPWTEDEIVHKLEDALKTDKPCRNLI
jgi:hypothetical protein